MKLLKAIIGKSKNGKYFVNSIRNIDAFYIHSLNEFSITIPEEEYKNNHGYIYFTRINRGFDYDYSSSNIRDIVDYGKGYHSLTALKNDKEGTWQTFIRTAKEKFKNTMVIKDKSVVSSEYYYNDYLSGEFKVTIEKAFITRRTNIIIKDGDITREEMINFIKNNPGVKVTHDYFSSDEYIYSRDNGNVYDECGYLFEDWESVGIGRHDGIRMRSGNGWDTGWSIKDRGEINGKDSTKTH